MKQTLEDYGLKFYHIHIKCDNTSVISLYKNLIQHSYTKLIEVRHIKGDIVLDFIGT
jgi:hypothetical protein